MTIRIKNGDDINFGAFGAAATVTHVRVRRASDDAGAVVIALREAVAVAQNNEFQIDTGKLIIDHPEGNVGVPYVRKLVEGFWGSGGSTSMEVDAMTDATTVVSVTGYSQQTTADWDLSEI